MRRKVSGLVAHAAASGADPDEQALMRIDGRELERLLWKYRLLAELRARREAVEAAGRTSFEDAEARERKRLFRRVAREFPGALRELDTLGASQLRARAERVEEALDLLEEGGEALQPGQWLAVIIDFHRTLRQTLMVKRWLARRIPRESSVSSGVVDEFTECVDRSLRLRGLRPGSSRQDLVRRGEERALLVRHHRPPGGRVLPLVWEALEVRHGRARAELELLIFGAIA